jgi:dienelactone hydrolase
MRALSWLLSLFLHAALAAVLIQTMHMARPDPAELMELDLTELAAPVPEEVITPLPAPAPPPEPEPLPEQADTAGPPPLPMDRTIVLDDAPQPPAPQPRTSPAPEAATAPQPPAPGTIDISPVKTAPPAPEPAPAPADDGAEPSTIEVRRHDIIAHRGHEARFGRSMMADYYSYEPTEFSGQFTTRDGRTISIIDARETEYGRFLIYDSKNRTLRRLKEFGKYVYTIGPSVHADEPVTGTVTFLAKNDRIERFILMTDDDRIAHFPIKVHVRERDVRFAVPGEGDGKPSELAGRTTLPPSGEGYPGVVLAYGGRCVDTGLVQGFTRALSASGLAVFSFSPRGCAGPGTAPGDASGLAGQAADSAGQAAATTIGQQAADTAAAVDHFAGLAQVDGARVGIWGNGPGASAALRAALAPGAVRPAYVVCLLDDAVGPDSLPGRAELARLDQPVLWLVTGRSLGRWQPFVTMLEGLRDGQGRAFTIVMAPLKASREVLDARGELSGWVEQVTEEHARLGASWITGLP